MCDPITIAGIALTAGSTVANTIAQNQITAARNDVLTAERIRQRALDQEASALNTTSQDRYTDFGSQQDQRTNELGDYFTSQHAQPIAPAPVLPSSTSNIVVNEENKQDAQAKDFTDQQGRALGELRSFGDLMGTLGRGQARDASLIGQIGGFKSGSSAVVPYELDKANEAGNTMHLLADIMSGLGSATTTAGLGGANLPSWLYGTSSPINVSGAPFVASTGVYSGAGVPRLGGLY